MPQKITGIIRKIDSISGNINNKKTIHGNVLPFMYLNPYIVACHNGYSGSFDEWVRDCVSLGEIINFEIDSNGCLIGTYDDKQISFEINGFGDLCVERRD